MLPKCTQILDGQCRMRFARRPEVWICSEMYLQRAADKPAPATPGEICRLCHFGNSEYALIEGARLGFPAGRHRKLYVIDRFNLRGRDLWRR